MAVDFMSTVAGQQFRANIASIARSLSAIAQEIKEQNEQQKQEDKKNEHR